MRTLLAGLFLLGGLIPALAADDDYRAEIEAWRAHRLERLTAPDGWLTLVGLHFLPEGESTLGRAADNDIVLAAGPDRIGSVTLDEKKQVRLRVNPGVDVLVDGRAVLSAELLEGRGMPPTLVTSGSMSFYVVNRGGKLALRVKDRAAPRRMQFAGIDHFPIDPTWRIVARWEPFVRPQEVPIKNILGQESPALVLGRAVFEQDGRTIGLLPIQDHPGAPLFFIISDLTSGESTYAAARFLYADPPEDGQVVLDFNQAINPPCAFTPFATCPLPPEENRLPIAVTAGEKNYAGGH